MLNSPENRGSQYYIDWLEKSIAEERIEYFEYSDFKNIQQIGSGNFGKVFRANWKNTERFIALKSFKEDKITLKEVINELNLHRKVDFHENILRFYGITKEETSEGHQMKKYLLVLEYANNGTLENYLNENLNELDWNDKLCLALQLSEAVICLHERGVIHRDLHAKNILVHQKNIKLADFGLSKKITESNKTSEIFGIVPYIDPKWFNNKSYKLNKKSDIYSIGVLMWQISSGREPFYDIDYDVRLILGILDGKREEVIYGTPVDYSDLYKECWKYEPNERPDMQKIVSTLKSIISLKRSDMNVDDTDKKKIHSSNSESTDEIMDINKSLAIDDLLISAEFENSSNSQNQRSTQSNIIMNSENSSNISIQTSNISWDSFESTFDNINNLIVNKLIRVIIKRHDKGFTLDQIQQLINQQILQFNQSTENLIIWLMKNQNVLRYNWFLGLFYYYNIDIEENSIKAFELFSKASENNYSIAQVYLAKCYNNGYGTKCDKKLAFNWYQKSAKNGSIIGQFYLGYCYELGIGTDNDQKKSVYWYKRATSNGNATARLYLAGCYKLGKGVEKNEIKAFEYYKILAEKKLFDAQFQLGNCFYYGIGTNVDKKQALYWYKKAASNGNIAARYIIKMYYNDKKSNKLIKFKEFNQLGLYYIKKNFIKTNHEKVFDFIQKEAENGHKIAQNDLGKCYRLGKGVKKDERKAFELFKNSAGQGYIDAQFQLGYCYSKGIGTDINKTKAFELYKIAAENDNSMAQNNLASLYKIGEGTEKDLEKAVYWYNKAAGNGNEMAQNNLGKCYELGNGVSKDLVKAFEYYKKSAKKGHLKAQYNLGYCYDKGIGTKVNKEKAIKLYKIAAEKGDNDAKYNLSLLYEEYEFEI